MIIVAIICTVLGGVLGAFLEPLSFSVSIPIAIMGGFILNLNSASCSWPNVMNKYSVFGGLQC